MNKVWEGESVFTAVDNFNFYEDATLWLERHLDEIPEDHVIFNAGVNYIQNKWRAGISHGAKQLVLFDDEDEGGY